MGMRELYGRNIFSLHWNELLPLGTVIIIIWNLSKEAPCNKLPHPCVARHCGAVGQYAVYEYYQGNGGMASNQLRKGEGVAK